MITLQRTTVARKRKTDPAKGATTASRENIFRVASRLLAKQSYAEMTIEDIAAAARVNRALVYYYFKNKASLVYEVACRAISSHAVFTEPIIASDLSPREKLEQLVVGHVRWRLTHPEIGGITKKDVRNLPQKLLRDYVDLRDRYEAMFRQVIIEGIDKGQFRPGNSNLLTKFTLGLLNSVDRWYKPKGELSIDQIGQEVWSYVSSSLQSGRLREVAESVLVEHDAHP